MMDDKIDYRFIDEVQRLYMSPGHAVEMEVAQWMQGQGFARPQTLVHDGAQGGLVIMPRGVSWLIAAGGGDEFRAPGTFPVIGEAGNVLFTVRVKGGQTQQCAISHEALEDHFHAADGAEAQLTRRLTATCAAYSTPLRNT